MAGRKKVVSREITKKTEVHLDEADGLVTLTVNLWETAGEPLPGLTRAEAISKLKAIPVTGVEHLSIRVDGTWLRVDSKDDAISELEYRWRLKMPKP